MSLDILRQEMELAILRSEAVHLTPQTVLKLLDDAEGAEHAQEVVEDDHYNRLKKREELVTAERNGEFAGELRAWLVDLKELHGVAAKSSTSKLQKLALLTNFVEVENKIASLIKELERYCAKL